MSWVILALLAAALGGAATVSNKYVFVRLSNEPMVQTVAGGVVGAVLSTIVTSLHGHGTLSGRQAVTGIIAGLFFGMALTTILYAVRLGDVSQVGPLRLLAPVFVAILAAIFLNETLSWQVYLGILLVLIGAALLDMPKSVKIKLNSVLGLMLISGLMLATMQVLTKYLLRFSDPYTVMLYVRFGLLLFTIPLLIKYFGAIASALKTNVVHNSVWLIIPGFLGTSSMFLLMFAADKGPVTVASALASTTPFFILVYATVLSRRFPDIYKERSQNVNLVRRALLMTVMFAGVILVLKVT